MVKQFIHDTATPTTRTRERILNFIKKEDYVVLYYYYLECVLY